MRWRPHLGPERWQAGAGRESSWPTQSPFSLSLSLFGDENARAKDSLQVQRAPLPLERLPNSTGLTWELGESHQSATAPHTANANGHHHNHPVQIQIQEIQIHRQKLQRQKTQIQFNNSTTQQFNNSTPQQFNHSTIQQINNSAIQQFNNSTIQQFNHQQFKPKK